MQRVNGRICIVDGYQPMSTISNEWMDNQLGLLFSHLGIYRLTAGKQFFFEPTSEFYELVAQGTIDALNSAIQQLADHIEAPSRPIIEEWEGSDTAMVSDDYDWAASKEPPPGLIRYNGPNHSSPDYARRA